MKKKNRFHICLLILIFCFEVHSQRNTEQQYKHIDDSIDAIEDYKIKLEIQHRIDILNSLKYDQTYFNYFNKWGTDPKEAISRIQYIKNNFRKIHDWETLFYISDELNNYINLIKGVHTFKYLLKIGNVPKVTTSYLVEKDNGWWTSFEDTSEADIYFAYWIFIGYAKGINEYGKFIDIIKKDHFLNFLHNNYPVVEDENMTKENILLFAKDFQKLDEDELNRLFEFQVTIDDNFVSFLYEIDSKQEFFRDRIQAGFKDQELFDSIATFDSTFFCNDELWKVKDMIKKKFSAKRNHYGRTWDAEPLERILKKYCVCREE